MRKKKKVYGCASKCETNIKKECSPYQKHKKNYDDCYCKEEKYEITCVDKCADLSKKAEELFEKAMYCECEANKAYDKAQECEKKAKVLNHKANHMLEKAKCDKEKSEELECKAQELMSKSHKLCEEAKCLYKQAKDIEKEAECVCEEAKCLYEKAHTYNEKAKCMYEEALKCDEKALQCYKTVEEKIKEYDSKSKKCEMMIAKCSNKLNECSHKNYENNMCDCYVEIEENCYEKPKCSKKQIYKPKKCYPCKEEIMYVETDCLCEDKNEDMCSSYVTPMYDMSYMHNMGCMCDMYPNLEQEYVMPYMNACEYNKEMMMNYYMMMQNMMPYNKR